MRSKCLARDPIPANAWKNAADIIKADDEFGGTGRLARSFIFDLKNGVPCHDCKRRFPHFVMDFDHVRGEKKFTIGKGTAKYSIEQLKTEVAKCDLVCANCHRIRTYTRMSGKEVKLFSTRRYRGSRKLDLSRTLILPGGIHPPKVTTTIQVVSNGAGDEDRTRDIQLGKL